MTAILSAVVCPDCGIIGTLTAKRRDNSAYCSSCQNQVNWLDLQPAQEAKLAPVLDALEEWYDEWQKRELLADYHRLDVDVLVAEEKLAERLETYHEQAKLVASRARNPTRSRGIRTSTVQG
jgi:hypothetical protein